jgi:hypothetical protein
LGCFAESFSLEVGGRDDSHIGMVLLQYGLGRVRSLDVCDGAMVLSIVVRIYGDSRHCTRYDRNQQSYDHDEVKILVGILSFPFGGSSGNEHTKPRGQTTSPDPMYATKETGSRERLVMQNSLFS